MTDNRATKNGHTPDGGTPQPRLTGDMLTSSILAFLRRWNAYGYQLVQELGKTGLPAFDSTTVYRTLRQLEKAGLVSSFWDTSESGPARRRYALTQTGETFLDLWMDVFGRYQKILQTALNPFENGERGAGNGAAKTAAGKARPAAGQKAPRADRPAKAGKRGPQDATD